MKTKNRNRVRSVIKSLKGEPFSYEYMREAFYGELVSDTVEQIIRYLRDKGEIEDCGKASIGVRAHVKLLKEVELKFEAEPHKSEVQGFDPIAGMRKYWPELFNDPMIPGTYRFIDKGIRQ